MEKLDSQGIENVFSLTPMQEGILFHYLKDPRSVLYFEQLSLEIGGKIDLQGFEKAWNIVIQANEMLRTVFRWEKLEKTSQVILKEHACEIRFHDFSDMDDFQKETELAKVKIDDKDEVFDLTCVPFRVTLCKLDETQYEMIISNHHILYDGWSNGIILKEFFSAYYSLLKKTQTLKLPVKPFFRDYIRWLQTRDKNKQEQFWRNYLDGFETATELPIKRKKEESTGAGDYAIILGQDIQSKLDIFAKNNRVTLASMFYIAWGILLQRYCGNEDVVFGTTVSSRSAGVKGIGDMVGLFINTIPLRINTYPGETIVNAISQIDYVLHEREEFEHTPLVDIQNYSSLGGNGALFDNIMVIENYPLDYFVHSRNVAHNVSTNNPSPENNLISIYSYSMVETTHYDLTVAIMLFKGIEIKFSFKQELFEKDSIENLAGHFRGIIQNMISTQGMEISRLEIISPEEKNRILYQFNNTATEYPRDISIHQLFEEQVDRTPDYTAVLGFGRIRIKKEEKRRMHFTYKELDVKSNQLAYFLIEKGVQPDAIIAIMIERSVEMVIGILGILKAGSAYLPIDPDYPHERIDYMLKDSGAKLLTVANNKEGEKVRSWEGEKLLLESIIHYSNHLSYQHSTFSVQHSEPHHLAYVIYTSGTTGNPKGVMVEHRSIFNTICYRMQEYRMEAIDKTLQLFSFVFDGFLTSFFTSVVSGSSVVLASRDEAKDITSIKKIIVTIKITHFICVPSLYGWLLDATMEQEFSSLKVVTLAGEQIRPELMKKSKQLFPLLEVVNEYGPTENSVLTSIQRDIQPDAEISIGKPIANTGIYIIDKYQNLVPIGIPGQLAIFGKGLARGYLNRPELTAEKFVFSSLSPKLYKTGDLARWLPDHTLEFLGRIDQQVKIRGFRIELGEIESQLIKHNHVKDAIVVTTIDETGDKNLVAYFVSAIDLPSSELREYLLKELPDYMIPSYFVRLEKIPLTPGGKVDRRALPGPELKKIEINTPPRNEIEKKLVELWDEILNVGLWGEIFNNDVSIKPISIDDNFFQLGGHSLKASILVLKIHKIFQVRVPLTKIFETPTIRSLADYIIKSLSKDKYMSIYPVEKKEYYPLSSAQKRMYIEQQMQIESKNYNIPTLSVLEGEIFYDRLENIFQALIKRHESLRTSFLMKKGEVVQIIHEDVDFVIEYSESEEANFQEFTENFLKPFDLSTAPLLRVVLLKVSATKHLLMVDMHHIISDGVSHQILKEEFATLYNGKKLPQLRLQYKDFSEWQNRLFQSGVIKKQEEYWLNRFKDNIPILNLPTDFPRSSNNISNQGDSVNFCIEEELTAALYKTLKNTQITLYMFLLAVYNILLSKFTSQTDIIVVSPITGRRHNDLENIMGMFVNMLVMRNQPDGEKIFSEFLEEVKTNLLNAYENQEYQFIELTSKLNLQGHFNKNPLLNTVFSMQNIDTEKKKIDSKALNSPNTLKITHYKYNMKISAFDLHLIASESPGKINLTIEYCVELFKESTIRNISKHYLEIIESVLHNPGIKINDIKVSSNLAILKQKKITDDKDFGF